MTPNTIPATRRRLLLALKRRKMLVPLRGPAPLRVQIQRDINAEIDTILEGLFDRAPHLLKS